MSTSSEIGGKSGPRVLLCPPMGRRWQRRVSVVDLNDNGLGYLASACNRAGADVTLYVWDQNLDLESFSRKLRELQPDLVGIKVFTTMFRDCCKTLRCVRRVCPKAVTVIGGPHPSTSRPEDLFAEFDGLLDYAVAGDGELGLAALVGHLGTGGGKPESGVLSQIPGLIYKDHDGVHANLPCLDVDLDGLAPLDWSLQDPRAFGTGHGVDSESVGVLFMDSRGCPGQCGFCLSSRINGPRPRHRDLGLLCEEIDMLVRKHGVRVLVFTGNAFMSDVGYVRRLCEWFLNYDTPLKWSCTGAAYELNLNDPDLLQLMRRAGCDLIYLGIESGCQQVRDRLRQPLTIEQCTEVTKVVHASGIRTACYFMFGFPGETAKEMDETIKYALSLPAQSIAFMICLPLPGTTGYEAVLEKHGLDHIDWATYDFSNPSLLPCAASNRQVKSRYIKAKILSRSRAARHLVRWIHGIEVKH